MNKFAFVPVAALALMTACSEYHPTGTTADALGGARLNQQTTAAEGQIFQAGNSNTWHGYNRPLVTHAGVTCFAWNDVREVEKAMEISGKAPDFYSFSLQQRDADGNWTSYPPGDLNDKASSTPKKACLDHLLADGTYRVAGTAHAKVDSKSTFNTSNHHTLDHTFTVGGYRIEAVGGNCKTGTVSNANAGNWNLTFLLYRGTEMVTDKSVYVNGSRANGANDAGEYHWNGGQPGTSSVTWNITVGSAEGASAGAFVCSAPTAAGGGKK